MEEVYKDRDQFASLVREVAAPDVGRMGIEVLSFTIKDVYDNVTYLASLGKSLWFEYHGSLVYDCLFGRNRSGQLLFSEFSLVDLFLPYIYFKRASCWGNLGAV